MTPGSSPPPLANMTAQLLWPRCAEPTFLHFLVSSCQPGLVQQYCRLLATWCDWHCHARQFLAATALLNSNEQEKACDLFLSAAGGVPGDLFLTQHLLNLMGETSEDLSVAYYLRASAWTWLAENRQAGGRETGGTVGEDAVEAAWLLLEHIVTRHEARG